MSENIHAEVITEEEEENVSVHEEQNTKSYLCGPLHPGRPVDEEPHIKKTLKKVGVKIDLILRVDLVGPSTKQCIFSNFLFLEVIGNIRR